MRRSGLMPHLMAISVSHANLKSQAKKKQKKSHIKNLVHFRPRYSTTIRAYVHVRIRTSRTSYLINATK